MLDPERGWLESKSKEITLPGDAPQALLLLLHIAHLRFVEAKGIKMTCESLLKIAVLCDKYDTVSLIRPFLDAWLSPILPLNTMKLNIDQRLFIYWTFGMYAEFEAAYKMILFSVGRPTQLFFNTQPMRDPIDAYVLLPVAVRGRLLWNILVVVCLWCYPATSRQGETPLTIFITREHGYYAEWDTRQSLHLRHKLRCAI